MDSTNENMGEVKVRKVWLKGFVVSPVATLRCHPVLNDSNRTGASN